MPTELRHTKTKNGYCAHSGFPRLDQGFSCACRCIFHCFRRCVSTTAANFSLIAGQLYKMGPDEILRRCVTETERPLILTEAHEGIVGGHYAGKATVQKVLRAGLWWPTLHRDVKTIPKSAMYAKEMRNHPEDMKCH
jgi:hypothetical protein